MLVAPGIFLILYFIAAAVFWVKGPAWSGASFFLVWAAAVLYVRATRPAHLVAVHPSTAKSLWQAFAVAAVLSALLGVEFFRLSRFLDLTQCTLQFLVSGQIWLQLRAPSPSKK